MMKRATRLAAAFAPLVLASCTDAGRAPPPTSAHSNLIRDELHNGGTTGFLFLPPMVPRPAHVGDFIPTVSPTVRIDEITSTGATVRTLATFTATTGPDRERLRTHLEDRDCDADDDDGDRDPEGYFYARWKTNNANLSVTALYRARVFVPAVGGGLRELGFADVQVVRSEREYRTVDTQNFTPLINGKTLRIKFRIDRPAVDADGDGVLDWLDNCPTTANATQRDANRNGKGDACECLGVVCRASDACHAVGTCDPATGLCANPLAADGTACSLNGSSAVCLSGTCTVLSCSSGTANCDGNAANGCETSTRTLAHCGACGVTCAAPAHASASCATGVCAFACDPGWADANGLRADGCELDVTTDANCGAPGNACVSDASGTSTCVAGACSTMACPAGRANCNTAIADGCEVSLTSDARHCGACGRACAAAHATAACVEGACAVGTCEAGYADCNGDAADGCEVTPASDVNHCGACGHRCALAHASAVCAAGACGVGACDAGWADCNGNPADGCEVDLSAPTSCGACGNVCSVPNATPACAAGACEVARCAAGFADCDSAAAGCETDLSTVANCGACGNTCASGPNATPVCGASGCAIACAAGFADCDGRASTGCEVDATRDRAHCGACGNVCGADEVCDGGACTQVTCAGAAADCNRLASDLCEVSTDTDVNHCGACGHVCSFANASAECVGGACGFAVCDLGYGDCDGAQANGCEADLHNDASHCGGCGTVCSFANAAGVCRDGACALGACRAGFADCDGDATNGCEADLSDTGSCGACGRACDAGPNATPVCGASGCAIACDTGFADCDGSAATGCEQDVSSDRAHCGACGNACGADEVCTAGACTAVTCETDTADCNHLASDLCEVITGGDVNNCGACGHVCAPPHAAPRCARGACALGACEPTWFDCDGDPSNGCEVNVVTSANNCGACGQVCPAVHSTPACVIAECRLGVCDAGWGDCDRSLANGCEVNVDTSLAHCGACGHACPTPPSSVATCAAGACGYACVAGQADCNGLASDGCERDVAIDRDNCGACGHACGDLEVCTAGACTPLVCPSDRADCNHTAADGCEVDLASDVANCNGCGVACAYDHASARCATGQCQLDACASGYLNCDASAANGCESLASSVTSCGACGNVCSLPNAVPFCAAGACGIAACNTGYADCNGIAADGCEVSLGTDTNNCGLCGLACNSAQACVNGACGANVSAIARGAAPHHTCVVQTGAVLCWGLGTSGQLGNGALLTSTVPVRVTGLDHVVSVAVGGDHTCAVRSTGEVMCWGGNANGQLGNGSRARSLTPVTVTGLTNAVSVAAGNGFSCAVLADGHIACWGIGTRGQLGNGLAATSDTPVTVSNLTNAVEVATGPDFTCSRGSDGVMKCWGWNSSGQIGDGTASPTPKIVPTLVTVISGTVTALGLGTATTCAVRSDGTIACWGAGSNGQLGGGMRVSASTTAFTVVGITNAVSVAGGAVHTCATLSTGGVRCWGNNSVGQLAQSSTATLSSPAIVSISASSAISTLNNTTCALRVDGTIQCWGGNAEGGVGDGSFTNRFSPVSPSGF